MTADSGIKRRSPRYRLPTSSPLPASLTSDSVSMIGLLMDISLEGFRFISREPLPDFWLPGRGVLAEFRIGNESYRGEGHIRHLTKLLNGQTSLGFQFVDSAIPSAQWNLAVEHMIRDKHAGSIWSEPDGTATRINVIGHFTANLSDEFKSAAKNRPISCLSLHRCVSVDGDAMDLLRKSHAMGFRITGAVGPIKDDLTKLGIPV